MQEGYTLVMPVPGDLPVMLEIAFAVCREQAARHRVATIVVPDRMTDAIRRIVDAERPTWPGPLELITLPRPERWILPILNNGWRNHGVQLIAGTAATRSTHLILHDADLFMFRPDFLDSRYQACQAGDFACLGVQPVIWDKWYAEHERQLAATWELTASVAWLRSWAPAMHISHEDELWNERHSFDTTLHPQCLTEPSRIGISGDDGDLVHFGYVTSTYRLWQAQHVHSDSGFVLLLTRMFIESFASDRQGYAMPSAEELADGLTNPDAPISFPSASEGSSDYRAFRTDTARILSGPWLSDEQRTRAQAVLAPFDRFYSYV